MGLDDGYGGTCRVCNVYHLDTNQTICDECLIEALFNASKKSTVKEAIKSIKDTLLKDYDSKWLFYDDLKRWKNINKFLEYYQHD